MMFTRNQVGLSVAGATVTLLVACGGGGSGTVAVSKPVAAVTTTAIALNIDDTFAANLTGNGAGLWSQDGSSADGGGDGAGGAGDGEFVKVRMRLPNASTPTGTLTWTVLRSQFGIASNTGTLSIQKDSNGLGGYKVTAMNGAVTSVRPGQSNFFISGSGLLSGTIPLPIGAGGSMLDSIFSGVRFKDSVSAATDMSEYAGTYVWGVIGSDSGTGANVDVTLGSLKLNADGSARSCSGGLAWSATCANGLDMVAYFDDPANRNLVRFVAAATQSQPIGAGAANSIDMLAVVRKTASNGVSFTADVTVTRIAAVNRTAAIYASRVAPSAISPLATVGAWNYTNRVTSPAVGFTGTAYIAIANVGGIVKTRGGLSSTNCQIPSGTLTPGPVNGALTALTPGFTNGYVIVMDADLMVAVTPGEEIGFARRYSTDPLKAPCQPS